MSQHRGKNRALLIACVIALLSGITACTVDDDQSALPTPVETPSVTASNGSSDPLPSAVDDPSATPNGGTSTEPPSAGDEIAAGSTQDDATLAPREADRAVCDDTGFVDASPIPKYLSDQNIPFYACSHEVTAVTDSEPFFVGEYVTDHNLDVVKSAILKQFEGSGWKNVEQFIENSNTVIKAQKSGVSLVLVVGPSRMTESSTSIYYTVQRA